MRYQRNKNNLDFFAQLVLLILWGQWGWFWLRHRLCGSLYRLICHLGLLYHYRVSCGLDVLHHSYLLPSSFLLGDLPKRHMWGVFHRSYIGCSWLHIVVAWHFLPSDFTFFYSDKNKPDIQFPMTILFLHAFLHKVNSSWVCLAVAKAESLRITLNLDGVPITCRC